MNSQLRSQRARTSVALTGAPVLLSMRFMIYTQLIKLLSAHCSRYLVLLVISFSVPESSTYAIDRHCQWAPLLAIGSSGSASCPSKCSSSLAQFAAANVLSGLSDLLASKVPGRSHRVAFRRFTLIPQSFRGSHFGLIKGSAVVRISASGRSRHCSLSGQI